MSGLPRIASLVFRYSTLPPRFGLTDEYQSELVNSAISGLIAVVAGVALFFGASGLTNLLAWIRRPADDDSDDGELEDDDEARQE